MTKINVSSQAALPLDTDSVEYQGIVDGAIKLNRANPHNVYAQDSLQIIVTIEDVLGRLPEFVAKGIDPSWKLTRNGFSIIESHTRNILLFNPDDVATATKLRLAETLKRLKGW